MKPRDIHAVHQNLAGLDIMHPVDAPDEGRFPRPGKADDRNELAVFDRKVDIRKGFVAVRVNLVDVF